MKRFSFDLEKVLALRAYRERETEIALGREVGALSLIEHQINQAASDRHKAASDRFAAGHSASEILSYEYYIHRLDAKTEALLKDAAEAELKVEEARALYNEASRDRKVIDKLKDKRIRAYKKALEAEENKTLDDISGGRKAREIILAGGN
jgi:flagellar FliJ protein